MNINDIFCIVKKIFKYVNFGTPVLSFIFGIILLAKGCLGLISAFFVIIAFPCAVFCTLAMDPVLFSDWEYIDEWEGFKSHKFSTILYWISSIVLVVAVIVAFAKGINSELSVWNRFWIMVWEYIKGCIPFWISAIVRRAEKETEDASRASDLRAMARRFRK